MLEPQSSPSPHRSWGAARVGIIVGIIALLLAAWGIISRVLAHQKLEAQTESHNTIPVNVTQPRTDSAAIELMLPGDVQAWSDAPIYARTSGYLKRWKVDIGATVKAGQVLAEIDTPEVDQQLAQAQADLSNAQANHQLAQTTAERWKTLLAIESVSPQEADEKSGDAAAKAAALASSHANLNRLRQLQGFKNIVAPFNGVITVRNVDVGDLINPGISGQRELFHIVDTHQLRVYVNLPQSYAASIKTNMEAKLRFAEHPGKTFPAKVLHTANAIDASTRTMLVQLVADNANNLLLPGAYAEVLFQLPANANVLRVPDNTLLFRGSNIQVATVDAQNKVVIKTITIGRDFGKEVEALTGVNATDKLIINAPDSIATGDVVRIIETPPKSAAAK